MLNDFPPVGDVGPSSFLAVELRQLLLCKLFFSHRSAFLLFFAKKCRKEAVLPRMNCSPFALRRFYFMNLDTNGEVCPSLRKWPEGPSPRNSENQDSCSISSFRIARARS